MKHFQNYFLMTVFLVCGSIFYFASCNTPVKKFYPKRDTVFVAVNYVGNNLQLDKAIVDSFQAYEPEDSSEHPKGHLVMHTRIYLGQWIDTVKDSVKRASYVKSNRPTGFLSYGPNQLLDSLTKFVTILHPVDNPIQIKH